MQVSFDVFADLVAFFRKGDGEDKQDAEVSDTNHVPSLKGKPRAAAGSAADAIRARQNAL